MLSKSVGDLSTSDLIGLSLQSRNESSIIYSGYVLKRSNNPWKDSSSAAAAEAATSGNSDVNTEPKNGSPSSASLIASMSKNRSSARLDLYDKIRSHPTKSEDDGLHHANTNNKEIGVDAAIGGTLPSSTVKPATLSSLLPPQSSMSPTPRNNNLTEAYDGNDFKSADSNLISNLTRIPNLAENINSSTSTTKNKSGKVLLAPRSSKTFGINDGNVNDDADNSNSISLVASMFGNESQPLSSKGKEDSNTVIGADACSYEYYDDDDEEDGYQSMSNPSQSSSSLLNSNNDSLRQQQSSDSSYIPQIPRSKTQPITIARTTSEDSDDYYNNNNNYNHLHVPNFNQMQQNPLQIQQQHNNRAYTTLIPPPTTKKGPSNLPRPLAYVRMTSAPAEGAKKYYPPPPNDYIDSKDGHIWRAKYCILEDGVLYFYPTAEIGNSVGAQQERSRMAAKNMNNVNSQEYLDIHDKIGSSSDTHINNSIDAFGMIEGGLNYEENDHLAKSPMPRKSMKMNYFNASGGNGLIEKDSFCHDPNVYWEKRVALDKVGNVRSNPDYGERVFELLAINSEEERDRNNGEQVDRLLLRAGSEHEMNLWIFEIHQSFVFLMKRFAEIVGSSYKSANAYLDGSQSKLPVRSFSSRHSLERFDSSPLSTTVLGTSLSHGHGRSLRRRRPNLDDSGTSSTRQTIGIGEGIINRMRSQSDEIFEVYNERGPPETLEIDITQSDYYPESKMSKNNVSSSKLTELLESTMPILSPKSIESHVNISSNLNNQLDDIKKYIPPQKRKNNNTSIDSESLFEQVQLEEEEFLRSSSSTREKVFHVAPAESFESSEIINFSLGGCADPNLIKGTICDEEFIPEKASKVRQSSKKPFGYKVGQSDIGATSTCGVRDSNEDAYLIVNDLIDNSSLEEEESYFSSFSKRSLFAIFDGHCGNHAARFSAEKLWDILMEESREFVDVEDNVSCVEAILKSTISRLDRDFCELCSTGNRDWFSGTTAIIALVLDGKLVVANVGDCRGILCRSSSQHMMKESEGWEVLDYSESRTNESNDSFDNPLSSGYAEILWREVANTHSPEHEEEKLRVEAANGWTNNSEQEVTIASQFQTIKEHFDDEDVRLMFLRWFSDRSDARHARILNIWRVCGDLAVSRAIGDREYKAEYGEGSLDSWRSTAPFYYPTTHSGLFNGDLIISTPDINHFQVAGDDNVLLLACDGLWDVLDADDAVRLTRKLVFERGLSARESAQRLAELAGHLGSSDNITVIIVRL